MKNFNPHKWLNHSTTSTGTTITPSTSFKNSDVERNVQNLIKQINEKSIDITSNYLNWRNIGFALADAFGENGRKYFHDVSRFYPKYTPTEADKQYTNCLKSTGSGITIGTLFHHAQQAGITVSSSPNHYQNQTMGTSGRSTNPSASFTSNNSSRPVNWHEHSSSTATEKKELKVSDFIVSANEEFAESTPILLQNNVPVFSSGEISLITGAPKAKKTFLVSAIIAALLSAQGFFGFTSRLKGNILLIDTEQGRRRTNGVVRRIYRMLNWDFAMPHPNFEAISIRELSASDRYFILEQALKERSYSIVFVDGFADLLKNTNELEESSSRVSDLMRLSEEHNTHICSIVHTNPNSDKTRGHVGSELQRKCETVMLIKKEDKISIVAPQFCRNMDFEKISFYINDSGLPEICELPTFSEQFHQVFTPLFQESPQIKHKDLYKMIKDKEGISDRTAERRIKAALETTFLKKNEDGTYSLA